MKYFVKNLKVHKHPVPTKCKVKYTGEKLHDKPPAGYEKVTTASGWQDRNTIDSNRCKPISPPFFPLERQSTTHYDLGVIYGK